MSKQVKRNIICGETTGTYYFTTKFYGLSDMHAKFQKAIDYTQIGKEEIIKISTGTKDDQMN